MIVFHLSSKVERPSVSIWCVSNRSFDNRVACQFCFSVPLALTDVKRSIRCVISFLFQPEKKKHFQHAFNVVCSARTDFSFFTRYRLCRSVSFFQESSTIKKESIFDKGKEKHKNTHTHTLAHLSGLLSIVIVICVFMLRHSHALNKHEAEENIIESSWHRTTSAISMWQSFCRFFFPWLDFACFFFLRYFEEKATHTKNGAQNRRWHHMKITMLLTIDREE